MTAAECNAAMYRADQNAANKDAAADARGDACIASGKARETAGELSAAYRELARLGHLVADAFAARANVWDCESAEYIFATAAISEAEANWKRQDAVCQRIVAARYAPAAPAPKSPARKPVAETVAPAAPAVAELAVVVKVPSETDAAAAYDVKLFADGRCCCGCKDAYYRGTYRGIANYACKHVKAARAQLIAATPTVAARSA